MNTFSNTSNSGLLEDAYGDKDPVSDALKKRRKRMAEKSTDTPPDESIEDKAYES